jgi:hypothetical protein
MILKTFIIMLHASMELFTLLSLGFVVFLCVCFIESDYVPHNLEHSGAHT